MRNFLVSPFLPPYTSAPCIQHLQGRICFNFLQVFIALCSLHHAICYTKELQTQHELSWSQTVLPLDSRDHGLSAPGEDPERGTIELGLRGIGRAVCGKPTAEIAGGLQAWT
uniref:Uncharacterized protein n=1 Tax=Cyanistes caeruleus TaxID=156563 RepID=A0A8C0TZ83_CYACU